MRVFTTSERQGWEIAVRERSRFRDKLSKVVIETRKRFQSTMIISGEITKIAKRSENRDAKFLHIVQKAPIVLAARLFHKHPEESAIINCLPESTP